MTSLREAILTKNLFQFEQRQFGFDPLPPCIFGHQQETFFSTFFQSFNKKVSCNVWI